MSEAQDKLLTARRERGAQLRALVVSWQEQKSYTETLADQQKQVEEGTFSPSDEWGGVADELLAMYMSIPKMTDWDEKKEDAGPKLILP